MGRHTEELVFLLVEAFEPSILFGHFPLGSGQFVVELGHLLVNLIVRRGGAVLH